MPLLQQARDDASADFSRPADDHDLHGCFFS
jgi:hypothetical protein